MNKHGKTMRSDEDLVQTWNLDAASTSIGFQVRHMVVTNVYGSFQRFRGTISGDPSNMNFTHVKVEIESASLDTHDRMRDKRLKGKEMFDCGAFPLIKFESTNLEQNGGKSLKITGILKVKDISKEVSVTAQVDPAARGTFTFSLKGKVSSEDFGLRWKSFFDPGRILVGSVVSLEARGKFRLAKAGLQTA